MVSTADGSERPPRRSGLALAALLGFVLVSTIGYLVVADRGGGEGSAEPGPATEELDRAGSAPLPSGSAAVALDPSLVPARYRVTYRVETYAGGEEVVHTESLEVDRPFLSRVELRAGPPPGERLIAERTASFARFGISHDGESTVLMVPPALAGSDLRPEPSLPQAEEEGLVERREVREVVGRRCQVRRAGGPASTGELVPLGAEGDGTYADLCFDAAGLLLEELWVQDGAVLRRRVATRVDDAPTFDDDHFALGEVDPLTFDEGGGSTRPVDPESRPGGITWELPANMPPALVGFERLGRYAVVPPRLEMEIDPGEPNRRRTAGIVDVWVRGIDVVFVDQGGTTGSEPPFDRHPHGRQVELGRLDLGEAFLDLRATEVRTAFTDGSFVRVYGTVTLDALLQIARALEPATDEGGDGLRYLDEPASD